MTEMEEKLVRTIIRGFSRSILLWLLDRKAMSGYLIIKEMQKITGHSFTSGAIYPLLYELENRGFIVGDWKQRGRRRIKYYSITEKGKKMLLTIRDLLEMPVREVLNDLLGEESSLEESMNT